MSFSPSVSLCVLASICCRIAYAMPPALHACVSMSVQRLVYPAEPSLPTWRQSSLMPLAPASRTYLCTPQTLVPLQDGLSQATSPGGHTKADIFCTPSVGTRPATAQPGPHGPSPPGPVHNGSCRSLQVHSLNLGAAGGCGFGRGCAVNVL